MTDKKQVTNECLQAINKYRKNHKVAALKYNIELDSIAQKWADRLASTNSLSHSSSTYKGERLGENCFKNWSSKNASISGNEVADSWYSEIKDYNFNTNSGSNTGHFTQLIWKESKEIGIGLSVSRDGKSCVVVANFYPAGNFKGRYAENVLPLSGTAHTNASLVNDTKPSTTTTDSRNVTDNKEPSKEGFFTSLFHRKPSPDLRDFNQEVAGSGAVTTTFESKTAVGPDGSTRTVTRKTATTSI